MEHNKPKNINPWLRALKGAPLSCLVALLSSEGAVVTRAWLCRATGYCKLTVSDALETLADWGLVAAAPEGDGWLLTEAVSQLGLFPAPQNIAGEGGPPDPAATETDHTENLEGRKIFFPQLVEEVKLINLNILTTTDSKGAQGEKFSHPKVGAGKRPKPDRLAACDVPRRLSATEIIFGEALARLRSPPSPRLVLAWISQAYRQRQKLCILARVVYANLWGGGVGIMGFAGDCKVAWARGREARRMGKHEGHEGDEGHKGLGSLIVDCRL